MSIESGANTPPIPPSPWLTISQAAHYARVGKRTAYGAVKRGELRHARIGGRREIRCRAEWVDAWLESHGEARG